MSGNPASKLTVGDLFRKTDKAFLRRLTPEQAKVAYNLAGCRTARMGGHIWRCDHCRKEIPMYNSCRDRHCPGCQASARFKWVEARCAELLPVPYFHVVFTLPHILNPLIAYNPRRLLGCLFQAASQALLKFAADQKYLGACPGILMVLHTWGQKLNRHYHVHCVVTGGGLTEEGEWKAVPSDKFLFPIDPLSTVFQGIYLERLEKLFVAQKLKLPPDWTLTLDQLKQRLYKNKWVVYAKPPFGNPSLVLKYLGRYTHRVAIANSRLTGFDGNMVTFKYKDYRDDACWESLTLPLDDFLNRFLRHVLPKGLMRIRSFGILSNPKKKASLARCREILGEPDLSEALAETMEPDSEPMIDDTSILESGCICPYCKEGILNIIKVCKQVPFADFLDSS